VHYPSLELDAAQYLHKIYCRQIICIMSYFGSCFVDNSLYLCYTEQVIKERFLSNGTNKNNTFAFSRRGRWFRSKSQWVWTWNIVYAVIGLVGCMIGDMLGKLVFDKLDSEKLKLVIYIGMIISGIWMIV